MHRKRNVNQKRAIEAGTARFPSFATTLSHKQRRNQKPKIHLKWQLLGQKSLKFIREVLNRRTTCTDFTANPQSEPNSLWTNFFCSKNRVFPLLLMVEPVTASPTVLSTGRLSLSPWIHQYWTHLPLRCHQPQSFTRTPRIRLPHLDLVQRDLNIVVSLTQDFCSLYRQ